jgi:predicted transcriptional regulator
LFTNGDIYIIIYKEGKRNGGNKMSTTGDRLKELRESLDYSVDEFAKMLGISRSSLYRYEGSNEPRDLPITLAIAISENFNVSLDWLAGTSDEKFRIKSSLEEVLASLSEAGKKTVLEYAMFVKAKENLENGK